MAHAELSRASSGEASPPRHRSLASTFDRLVGALVEIPAALLVIAEIVILFAGVVARYGLHRPLIWSDELASILFLWLAMLGAAVAFRRGHHRATGSQTSCAIWGCQPVRQRSAPEPHRLPHRLRTPRMIE